MTDSVSVFPPGYRLTDADTGAPISGAIISFFNAGTTDPKTVYADEDLLVEAGTTVTTDALGYPTSDGGNTKSLIYVGTEAYKVACTDANGSPIFTHDNVKGAVASLSSSDIAVTALFPVVTKSLDYAVVAGDQNTTFAVNCSAGNVNLTLPSAVTVGAGWKIKVQHAGAGNSVIVNVATGSGQLISEGSKSHGGKVTLVRNGEDLEISSDGGNWRVSSHTGSFVKTGQGVIPITDRASSAPASPAAGALYLATAAGTWGTVSVAQRDIVQWTGATWITFTPYTDCGWIIYVADEDRNYQYVNSGWQPQPLSTSGTQATMEAETAGSPVTADVQKYHPAHPKAWANYSNAFGLIASYGVSGVTRNATGQFTVFLSPAMSSSAYAPIAIPSGANVPQSTTTPSSASGFSVFVRDSSGNAANPDNIFFAVFGDQ